MQINLKTFIVIGFISAFAVQQPAVSSYQFGGSKEEPSQTYVSLTSSDLIEVDLHTDEETILTKNKITLQTQKRPTLFHLMMNTLSVVGVSALEF